MKISLQRLWDLRSKLSYLSRMLNTQEESSTSIIETDHFPPPKKNKKKVFCARVF